MMIAALAIGNSTLTLLFNMGVMTMKMIRSTSITSTIGVTLMLELTVLPSSRLLIPIRVLSRPIVAGVRRYDAARIQLRPDRPRVGTLQEAVRFGLRTVLVRVIPMVPCRLRQGAQLTGGS